MPKVTIEFNLPEEQSEFDNATNGDKYLSVLYNLDCQLRNWIKWDSYPEEWKNKFMAAVILQHIRDFLNAECEDKQINIYND
jgi:hypothetical protein